MGSDDEKNLDPEAKAVQGALRIGDPQLYSYIDYAPDAIYIVNLSDGRIINCNRQACFDLGYTKEELLRLSAKDIEVRLSQDEIEQVHERSKSEITVLLEGVHRRKDGSTFPVEVHHSNLGPDLPQYSLSVVRDITDRKLAEEELTYQRMFSSALLENVESGVVACNEKGELVLFNRAARDWHGLDLMNIPQAEWASHYDLYLEDGVTPMDINTVPLARAFRGETIHGIGMVISAKGQPKRHVIVYAGPIKTENGRVLGAVAVMHDISDRKLADSKLKESEGRFRSLFENMAEGVALHEMIYDESGAPIDYRVLNVNAAYEKNIGIPAKRAIGFLAGDLYGIKPAPYVDKYAQVARDRKPIFFETFFEPFNKYFDISVFSPKEGQFVTVFQDITERKKLEDKIRESEERLRILVENASDGILLADIKTRRFTLANNHIQRMLGYSEEELLKLYVPDIHPGGRLTYVLEQFDRLSSGEVALTFDIPMLCKDGKVFYSDVAGAKISLQGEECMLGIFRDATTRKRAEEYAVEIGAAKAVAEAEKAKAVEIEAAYNELQRTKDLLVQSEKLASLGEFTAGIAHELNNPLAGILLLAGHYLGLKSSSDAEYEDLKQIIQAGERMAEIVRGLLDFSRPSSGEMVPVSCNDVIEVVMIFGQKTMINKNIDVQKNYEKNLPVVMGDKSRLQQVVINIISNARDAVRRDGLLKIYTRTVTVEGKRFVEMEFKDNGVGITDENMKKVFDPFFTTKRPGKGTGLGLSVAYSIIKEHNGEISVESPPVGEKRGTTFRIRIPAA
ncbi:MAG: PAS domain S-box protein [Candidatus Omnitrophica bacterium]|nr:PAS domain S-box protein [Candidatus Omnitrophota bacterium]